MKKYLSALLALLFALQLCVTAPLAEDAAADDPTADYNFNIGWKFSKPNGTSWPLADAVASTLDSAGRKFYEPDFDDSAWQEVSLPHTFNDEDSFRSVAQDPGEGGSYRGIAFYRKTFGLDSADSGKKVIVEFEKVRQAAYVYINGELAGYYEMGVSPFGIDLTKYVKFGEENVIAVAIDNTSSRGMTRLIAETMPGSEPGANDGASFQWNTKDFNPDMGGLAGNAVLHLKNSVYQTLPLYSNLRTKGTYIYADNINVPSKTADIHVESEIRNESGAAVSATLEAQIIDADGKVVQSFKSDAVTIAPAGDTEKNYDKSIIPADAYAEDPAPTETASLEATVIGVAASVSGLRLWSPDDPYLYTVRTILTSDGEVTDVEEHKTGFRKVEIKGGTDGGVFINDKHIWLTGYAQRSTNEWAAIGIGTDWLKDYDAQLIRESNANFVRWMHIAAQPADIRSFDKYGVVCVQPAGDKESDVTGRQWDQRMEVMRDTIIYFRNSPSIIFFESGNSANSAEHMKEMTALKNELDPHGMRAIGSRSIIDPEAVAEAEYVGTMLGRNVWDGKTFTEEGAAARDARAVVETEYHREESPRRVWDDYSPPDFDYRNTYSGGSKKSYMDAYDLTAEDFVLSDAKAYNEFYQSRTLSNSETPYYSAAAALCWSDSNQHGRQQASENARMSGRVDPVRIKKQSFYAYKTMQSEEPSVYIVGHWNYPEDPAEYEYELKDDAYNYTGETALRDPKNKTVYVIASNVASVKLFINGAEAGSCEEATDGFVYSFPGIDITQHGYIEAVGYDADGTELARNRIDTAGEPAQIRLTPVTGPNGLYADGEDVAYIDVEVVDENGNVCPLDYDRIDFEVSGPAKMMGGYNSGVADLNHSNSYVYAECGTNRIFLRSTREAGEITVTAKRAGMFDTTVKLTSVPFETDENGLTLTMPQTREYGLSAEAPVSEPVPVPMQKLSGRFTVSFGINTSVALKKDTADTAVVIMADGVKVNADAYKLQGVYGEIIPVLEALGAQYSYDEQSKTLTASYNGNTIQTTAESSEMLVNGEPSIINDWPTVKDGVLYAEISAVAANLGYNVKESDGMYEIWR